MPTTDDFDIEISEDDDELAPEDRCPQQCDHQSQCVLEIGHEPSDEHLTEHNCIFFDLPPAPAPSKTFEQPLSEHQAHALGIGVLPGIPSVLTARGVTQGGVNVIPRASERLVVDPKNHVVAVFGVEPAIEPEPTRDPACKALGRHQRRCACTGSMRAPL